MTGSVFSYARSIETEETCSCFSEMSFQTRPKEVLS